MKKIEKDLKVAYKFINNKDYIYYIFKNIKEANKLSLKYDE